ncbi:Metastasis-associated protein MTA2 [Lonchura striata]|uniref:Metastasis-associated protein MTA2 n=1 Tax=Lonchura striata TaxID=40157 RepID=A0A218UBF0_9PASE|nr:Metastasis-associated protein MTA2 [Lonchura striata domestica]
MAANMYRVGDYVYFENSSSNPYLVRRIEELNKTANGNVEAKVVCLFRRRDISSSLNSLADSNAREFEEESKQPPMTEQQRHQLKHRELFLSRQFESLPATHIRGKCSVTLLNETDILGQYLEKEDCFFYSLVFDPVQKTLLADQGEIRVGCKYQAEIPERLAEGESDNRNQQKMEMKVWDPDNPLTDRQIDQFLVVARGKCSVTLLNETDILGQYLEKEDCFFYSLVFDPVQKTLLADQGEIRVGCKYQAEIPERLAEGESDNRNQQKMEMKVWDPDNPLTDRQIDQFLVVARAVGTFARALDCSSSIRQPSLHMSAAAASRDITLQVYIPTYTKPNPNQIISVGSKPGVNGAGFQKGLSCESCHTSQSPQWYAWGPPNMQCRLCASCWIYWKKYGGLKTPTQLEGVTRSASLSQSRGLAGLGGKRGYEAGGDGHRPPRMRVGTAALPFSANGRPLAAALRPAPPPGTKRQKLNPADAPNPVVFVATKDTRYGA